MSDILRLLRKMTTTSSLNIATGSPRLVTDAATGS